MCCETVEGMLATCPVDGSGLPGGLVEVPSPPGHVRVLWHLGLFLLVLGTFADLARSQDLMSPLRCGCWGLGGP